MGDRTFLENILLLHLWSAWGFFYATTIFLLAYITTPAPCVSWTGQAASRDFDKGKAMGSLARQNSKAPAVLLVPYGCIVAEKNPRALLLQFATYLSFRFPVVIPFAGNLERILGKSPEAGSHAIQNLL
jgi:hypothetical protein